MNIGKKKWAILFLLAFIMGTGSYVFANPSLDTKEDILKSNHSASSETNEASENQNNSDMNVMINQDDLNMDILENMDVSGEETQILEEIINNINTEPSNGSNLGNIENSNSGNSGNENLPNTKPDQGTSDSEQPGNTEDKNENENTGGKPETPNPSEPINPDNPDLGDNPDTGENLPNFVFEENGSFSTNTIIINDPNYDHMIVYNWDMGSRNETYENQYTIEVDNAVYVFIVFYKDGTYKGFTMHHVKETN